MSIKLPQYTIQTAEQQNPNRKWLVPLLVIASFFIGYIAKSYMAQSNLGSLELRNEVLEDLNSKNQDKIVQQETQLSVLKTKDKVKDEAILLLQKDYRNSIDSQKSLESDISFYQRLLSPSIKNKGLRVFETKLQLPSKNNYKLKIILVQKLERAVEIKGKIVLEIKGLLNNKDKSIQVQPGVLNYKFKYFQDVSLDFSLPDGFKASQLVVKLIPNYKKSKPVTHIVDWNSLIK